MLNINLHILVIVTLKLSNAIRETVSNKQKCHELLGIGS